MAKRKRLDPAAVFQPGEGPAPEVKARDGWAGVRRRAPIADVSGDAAAQSAFEEVASELRAARTEGRMVIRLPLAAVDESYLVRDRMAVQAEEMDALIASLRARGQQTPIEVVELAGGQYGLISGWRRLRALQALLDETGDAGFGFVTALIRAPEGAADAYRGMVEENEIRANLSFYERAHIAVKSAEQGVFDSPKEAVQSLFSAASSAKRSKILGFVRVAEALGDLLRWPETMAEKKGLALAAALKADPGLKQPLRRALQVAEAQDAEAERAALETALRVSQARPATPAGPEVVPGIAVQGTRGKIVLTGPSVDGDLLDDLRGWLEARLAEKAEIEEGPH